jgi:hypothetical protein
MDLELTNRQKQIRLAAREFAEGELVPIGKECETKGEFPRDLIKKAAQLGFIGCFIKKEYGGLGLGLMEHAIILEEFWRAEPGLSNSFPTYYFPSQSSLTSLALYSYFGREPGGTNSALARKMSFSRMRFSISSFRRFKSPGSFPYSTLM